MALKDTIQELAQLALVLTDDLRINVDYHSVTVGSYDPVTDAQIETTVMVNLNIILARFTEAESDFIIQDRNAQKAIMAQLDLTIIVPKADDYIMIGTDKWEVMKVKGVPGDSVWILAIRLP